MRRHLTYDTIKAAALNYSTRTEFRNKDTAAYEKAMDLKILDDVCSHMKSMKGQYNKIYTYDYCKELVTECTTIKEFREKYPSANQVMYRNGWWEELSTNLINTQHQGQNRIWTYDICKEEALKYQYRNDFQKNSLGAYDAARRNGWLDEICSHMTILYHKYSKEECIIEALKYGNKNAFKKGSRNHYIFALNHGWLEECCTHMTRPDVWNKKYNTLDSCLKEALKFKSRSDFSKHCPGAYQAAMYNGWLDECCAHMERVGNLKRRCIYVWEFIINDTKYAYIGLTCNHRRRENEHKGRGNGKFDDSQVLKFIKNNGLNPDDYSPKYLTEYLPENEASIMEGFWEQKYQDNGWTILNVAKTGGLGGSIPKWTFETCKEEALKYDTITDFRKYSRVAYCQACRYGWIREIAELKNWKVRNKWTKQSCIEEAKKYSTYTDFMHNSYNAYQSARYNNWTSDIVALYA